MHVLRQARANAAISGRCAIAAHAALSRGEQLDCRLHQQQQKMFVFKRQEHVTQRLPETLCASSDALQGAETSNSDLRVLLSWNIFVVSILCARAL